MNASDNKPREIQRCRRAFLGSPDPIPAACGLLSTIEVPQEQQRPLLERDQPQSRSTVKNLGPARNEEPIRQSVRERPCSFQVVLLEVGRRDLHAQVTAAVLA
jgi:hypothetical protein